MNIHIDKKTHFVSVSDFLSTNFITVNYDDSLIKITKKLLQQDQNFAIVIENVENKDIPVGIITLKDLLKKIIENFDECIFGLRLEKIFAKDVMSIPLIYTFLNQPIWDALDLMYSKNISLLPVLDSHDKIQGVIRINTILKNLSEF